MSLVILGLHVATVFVERDRSVMSGSIAEWVYCLLLNDPVTTKLVFH